MIGDNVYIPLTPSISSSLNRFTVSVRLLQERGCGPSDIVSVYASVQKYSVDPLSPAQERCVWFPR